MSKNMMTVHEAAEILNESGRSLGDFLKRHELNDHDEVKREDVANFIRTTEPCGPITDEDPY